MKKKSTKYSVLILAGFIVLIAAACDPSRKYEKQEEEEIDTYLRSNPAYVFEQKPSGLYYLDLEVGTGATPTKSDTAYTFYTAKFLNGNTFDTNVGTTDTLIRPVNEGYLIQGYEEGILNMKVGGTALLLIPSSLGYGSTGYYFPAYTPITFEIKLVKLVEGPSK